MAMSTQRLILTLLFFNLITGIVMDTYMSSIQERPNGITLFIDYGKSFSTWTHNALTNVLPKPLADLTASLIDLLGLTTMLIGFILYIVAMGFFTYLTTMSNTNISSVESIILTALAVFAIIYNFLIAMEIFLVWKANKGT